MASNDDLIAALARSPLQTNDAIRALAATVGAVTTGPGAGPAVGHGHGAASAAGIESRSAT